MRFSKENHTGPCKTLARESLVHAKTMALTTSCYAYVCTLQSCGPCLRSLSYHSSNQKTQSRFAGPRREHGIHLSVVADSARTIIIVYHTSPGHHSLPNSGTSEKSEPFQCSLIPSNWLASDTTAVLTKLLMLCKFCGAIAQKEQIEAEVPWDLYLVVLVLAVIVIFCWEGFKKCRKGKDVRLRALRARSGYGKMTRDELKELQLLLALELSDLTDAQGLRLFQLRNRFETTMPAEHHQHPQSHRGFLPVRLPLRPIPLNQRPRNPKALRKSGPDSHP